jgi:hypothetical protein
MPGHSAKRPFSRTISNIYQTAKSYPLDEVLLLHLQSVLAESEAITDVARFGEMKLKLLRRRKP